MPQPEKKRQRGRPPLWHPSEMTIADALEANQLEVKKDSAAARAKDNWNQFRQMNELEDNVDSVRQCFGQQRCQGVPWASWLLKVVDGSNPLRRTLAFKQLLKLLQRNQQRHDTKKETVQAVMAAR